MLPGNPSTYHWNKLDQLIGHELEQTLGDYERQGSRSLQVIGSQKVRHDLETEQLDYIQDDVTLISYRTEFN